MKTQLLIGIISILLVSCAGEKIKTEQSQKSARSIVLNEAVPKEEANNMITVVGTIRRKHIEGGFWGLDSKDGKKYMPSGLNKDLLIDGMIIEVKGIIVEDVMTFQQYGKTLKVKESRIIDDSDAKVLNSH